MSTATEDVVLVEEDVPGASLGGKRPDELKVPELKWWLAARGASRQGNKSALIERVNDYIRSGAAKDIVDPDNGANLEVKRRRLGIAPGCSEYAPVAPTVGWCHGLVDVPDLKYTQMYNYLVASKAITADGAEMGAMKSLKAVKFFKEGYVQGLQTNHTLAKYTYITSKTQASMKRIMYNVTICLDKVTADILSATRECPAGEWPSAACSHVAATLFAIEDHVSHREQVACTSQLQQWHKPSSYLHQLEKLLMRHEFQDESAHSEAVTLSTTVTCLNYDPRRPSDRSIDKEQLEHFKEDLSNAPFQCGWFLQLTPAVAETTLFPLSEDEQKRACSKLLETLCITDAAAVILEQETKKQSESSVWHQSRSGRITASNFGRVLKCSWFKSRSIISVLSLVRELISPVQFKTRPPPMQWGIDHEATGAVCYLQWQQMQGKDEIHWNPVGSFSIQSTSSWVQHQTDWLQILVILHLQAFWK